MPKTSKWTRFQPQHDWLIEKILTKAGISFGTTIRQKVDSTLIDKIALQLKKDPRQVKDHLENVILPNRSEWTSEESDALMKFYKELGGKWATIALLLGTNRSDNQVRNRYRFLSKRQNSDSSGNEFKIFDKFEDENSDQDQECSTNGTSQPNQSQKATDQNGSIFKIEFEPNYGFDLRLTDLF